jgi:RNA polymerase sigma-70 factor (ECF subfamily)
MTADETSLLDGLRRGDDAAYTALVERHAGRMLATARRLLRNDEDARDAVQEALIAATRAIDEFEGGARLSTWLHRIVVNAALMRMRSARRRREEPIDDLLPTFDEEGHRIGAGPEWPSGADALVEREETRALVRRSIDRLPDAYRVVLQLRDLEDLDTQEVADLLSISPNAVKVRLHRARQALRTLLERELIVPPRPLSDRLTA